MRIDSLLSQEPKVSKKILPALDRLGIRTVRDLLLHFPARYEDFSNEKAISDVSGGETVTVRAVIKKISGRKTARKKMFLTEATVVDESGAMKAVWFNQPFLARTLHAGVAVSLSGKVISRGRDNILQNPAHERMSREVFGAERSTHTGGLVAIYPETEGITSRWLRYLIKYFLFARTELPDVLPEDIRRAHHLPSVKTAIKDIHFPATRGEAEAAERRFAFEELFLIQLHALRERGIMKQRTAQEIPFDLGHIKKFVATLPFALTDAQRRSIWEIARDIQKSNPMNRLLEGDVGSGKTVVAAAALLLAARAGGRAALMAPTEILATQHFETLSSLLAPFNIRVDLRTGERKTNSTDVPVVVGTHALLHAGPELTNFSLVIIDEQHRFGVSQRAQLLKKRIVEPLKNVAQEKLPHFLSMTATPIPRTLALTIYGNLDLSMLDEVPSTRKKIITRVVGKNKREEAYGFVRSEVAKGRQVFIICPRVEIKEAKDGAKKTVQSELWADVRAVKQEYERLSKEVFPNLSLAMLHGKLKPKEKEEIMAAFKARTFDMLVATSVVEVGVDVPNATVMIIEGAERFGLSQLHQFRGRVGRGDAQSYCLLFATEGGTTRRLKAMCEAKNGFELAEYDLAIRGPGDMFGTLQSGVPNVALRGITDASLVRSVREEAAQLLAKDPELSGFTELRARIEARARAVHEE